MVRIYFRHIKDQTSLARSFKLCVCHAQTFFILLWFDMDDEDDVLNKSFSFLEIKEDYITTEGNHFDILSHILIAQFFE